MDSKGFLLNLDLGTMIANNENIECLYGRADKINHVHISEPGLKVIEERGLHRELREFLRNEGYQRFVSIEMAKVDDIHLLEKSLDYIRRIFG